MREADITPLPMIVAMSQIIILERKEGGATWHIVDICIAQQ
jgi:hypothetical protein